MMQDICEETTTSHKICNDQQETKKLTSFSIDHILAYKYDKNSSSSSKSSSSPPPPSSSSSSSHLQPNQLYHSLNILDNLSRELTTSSHLGK